MKARVRGAKRRANGRSLRLNRIRDLSAELANEASTLEVEYVVVDAIGVLDAGGDIDFVETVSRFECHLVKRALDLAGGNKTKAARLLHLPTSTFHNKLETCDLL